MLIEETLDKLNAMKIGAMADACRQQMQTDEVAALGFEKRFGFLVDAEWTAREQRKLQRRLHSATSCRGCRSGSPPSESAQTSAGTVDLPVLLLGGPRRRQRQIQSLVDPRGRFLRSMAS